MDSARFEVGVQVWVTGGGPGGPAPARDSPQCPSKRTCRTGNGAALACPRGGAASASSVSGPVQAERLAVLGCIWWALAPAGSAKAGKRGGHWTAQFSSSATAASPFMSAAPPVATVLSRDSPFVGQVERVATSNCGPADNVGDSCASAWCSIGAWDGTAANR